MIGLIFKTDPASVTANSVQIFRQQYVKLHGNGISDVYTEAINMLFQSEISYSHFHNNIGYQIKYHMAYCMHIL